MRQHSFTLVRESDAKEWHTVARTAFEAVSMFRHEIGMPLFSIGENAGDYALTWRHPDSGDLWRFGVMDGEPTCTAKLWATEDGYRVSLARKAPGIEYLRDVYAKSVEEGLGYLEAAIEKYEISPQECEVVRPYHADGGY